MKLARIITIVVVVYAGVVVAFESWLGSSQPAGQGTLVITTLDPDGTAHDRVVANYETDGSLYVSANHWPRAWYRRALANPDVRATVDGVTGEYHAVPVTGERRRGDRMTDVKRMLRSGSSLAFPHGGWFGSIPDRCGRGRAGGDRGARLDEHRNDTTGDEDAGREEPRGLADLAETTSRDAS